MHWENWNKNQRSTPASFVQPTHKQLYDVVTAALNNKQKVRVVGAGHSWSGITKSDSACLINLDKVSGVTVNGTHAKVHAGTRLFELNNALAAHKLALSTHGSIDLQSIAGVIATGTHGTGLTFGVLSSYVTELELINGNGELITCSAKNNAQLFRAAQCNLGSLGVLTSVTLQCEEAFNLEGVEEVWKLDDVLDNLDTLLKENDHFKFWWIPHTESALVFRQNRTNRPRKTRPFSTWMNQTFLRDYLYRIGLLSARAFPKITPQLNALMVALTPKRNVYVNRSDKIFTYPLNIRHWESEYALPLKHTKQAIEKLRDTINTRFNINFVLEVRFVKEDNILLSPAHKRVSCYIDALQARWEDPHPYFSTFENIMDKYKGRPHWGKLHTKTAAQLKKLYPEFKRFVKIRDKMDPHQLFMNEHLKALFY